MKITSWNVNGIRAAVGKEFLKELKKSKSDIYCLQETKAQNDQVEEALKSVKGYQLYVHSAVKKGYSGVTILSKEKPINVSTGIGIEKHEQEGRILTCEFEKFTLVNVYVPNSGSGLKRLDYRAEWDKEFTAYLNKLKTKKPIIVAGDFNVAHEPIDLARPKSNYNKTAGYTQVEIDGMDGLLRIGLFDAFREFHPDEVKYSFWSVRFGARAKNVGWRLDYFLTDKKIMEHVKDSTIDTEIMGSDHCPINLELSF